jgi:hypothetical protein
MQEPGHSSSNPDTSESHLHQAEAQAKAFEGQLAMPSRLPDAGPVDADPTGEVYAVRLETLKERILEDSPCSLPMDT